jgi:hypothetical protein
LGLNLGKPVRFNHMVSVKTKDNSEIRRRKSQWNNQDNRRDHPHRVYRRYVGHGLFFPMSE